MKRSNPSLIAGQPVPNQRSAKAMNLSPTDATDPATNVAPDVAPDDSITAALDDAVERLDALVNQSASGSRSQQPLPQKPLMQKPLTEKTIPKQPLDPILLELVNRMVSATSRRDAAVQLVEVLANQSPNCSVRCGFGKSNLNLLYDYRLGWLGPESSLHQTLAAQWNDKVQSNPSDLNQSPALASCSRDQQRLHFVFPNDHSKMRFEVWVDSRSELGDEGHAGSNQIPKLDWFESALTTVGLTLWSRPVRSLPSFVIRIARRGKLSLGIVGMVLLMLAVWPVHYRVASTSRVDTMHQRIISAPFDATLLRSSVLPGDTVSAGDVLLELDGRPLRLEQESILAEVQQVEKEHNVALATGRIAEGQQAALRKRQLTRQLDLIRDRLGRLTVVSPIAGVVVHGDLQRFEGSALTRGQTLLEVAPMNKMILEVELPEYEIGYVEPEALTRVKIDAIGGRSFTVTLQSIFPRSEIRDDRNVFVARAVLDNSDHRLRPGMRGEAITYGPLRPWIWSWVRASVERLLWWIGY